jgi:hypothetical protein
MAFLKVHWQENSDMNIFVVTKNVIWFLILNLNVALAQFVNGSVEKFPVIDNYVIIPKQEKIRIIHQNDFITQVKYVNYGNIKRDRIDTLLNDEGFVTVRKIVYYGQNIQPTDYECFITVSKNQTNLYLKHYTWKNGVLIKTNDNGVVRKINKGKTYCEFSVVEDGKDTVLFNLDAKQDITYYIDEDNDFSCSIHDPQHKSSQYDAIIYSWYHACKDSKNTRNSISGLKNLLQHNGDTIHIIVDKKQSFQFHIWIVFGIMVFLFLLLTVFIKWKRK